MIDFTNLVISRVAKLTGCTVELVDDVWLYKGRIIETTCGKPLTLQDATGLRWEIYKWLEKHADGVSLAASPMATELGNEANKRFGSAIHKKKR